MQNHKRTERKQINFRASDVASMNASNAAYCCWPLQLYLTVRKLICYYIHHPDERNALTVKALEDHEPPRIFDTEDFLSAISVYS